MTLQEKLAGKNIIFFSVQTFSLEKKIKDKLEELGANVYYYDERPANNNFTKGIIRLRRNIYQKRIDKYYKNILYDNAQIIFDYLFVNRGEVIPAFFLEEFKKQHCTCEFIFYTWDSFTNHKHPITILKYFDRKSTFDPEDSKKYKIGFRPLFYLDEYRSTPKGKIEYDVLFLGTAHSDRYRISSEIKAWCDENNLSTFCYYYMQGRLVYLFKRLFDTSFKKFDYKKLSFQSLTLSQILKLYQTSRVILDINHPNQKGLTMRTFEALGVGRKLITTNKEIKRFPFYCKNNVYIIDRDEIVLKKSFFETEYEDLDINVCNKFSLEGWLYNIFIDSEESFWVKCI